MLDDLSEVLPGVGTTLSVTLLAFLIGSVLGLFVLAGMRSRRLAVRAVAKTVVDFVRAVPPIVWLFLIFYGLPEQFDITLTPYASAVIGLGVISAMYLAEIYRAGLLAVRRTQWEAAAALGLNAWTGMRRVIAPQAFRVVLPSAATLLIALLKDSAVISILGVQDITSRAVVENQRLGGDGAIFIAAALLYIALSIPVAVLSRWADARVARGVAR